MENDYNADDPGPSRYRSRQNRRGRHGPNSSRSIEGSWRRREVNDSPHNSDHQQGGYQHTRTQGFLQRDNRPLRNDNPFPTDLNRRQLAANNLPQRTGNRQTFMGFKALEELALSDSKEIIVKINERKESFLKILESPIDKDKWDMFVLIVKLISKVCQSSLDELKAKFILEICNSPFIGHLSNYLMELPYMQIKTRHNLYWHNPQDFWNNFALFCECIINISPSTALHKCRPLIELTSKCCLELLKERHDFEVPEEIDSKIKVLRDRLTICEKEDKPEARQIARTIPMYENSEPPDDFRGLSVLPKAEDLLDHRPFVRPNIIAGGYRDLDHYLDVQFRLLREDCFGPLREGITQFLENPTKRRLDHIRVIHNVKFVSPYISKDKFGSIVQFDDKTIKRLKKINWAYSKRFIFGSLLLFTKDNCKTFITATILDRDVKLLNQGKIPVSVVDVVCNNLYDNSSYVMIESEVYFEAYHHVLKALQDPEFPKHIAMSKYIVTVDAETQPPAYLSPGTVFAVQTVNSHRHKFQILAEHTWPTNKELDLNESQYEAYKLALSHEFAVIQGPPGTGKTFLGVKVAKTLLKNLTPENGSCLLLVICYTNHALDQFLEAILPVTNSIVRIGGQSRNEAMEKLNLTHLRRTCRVESQIYRMFLDQRNELSGILYQLQKVQELLDSVNGGIISYDTISINNPKSKLLGEYYAKNEPHVQSDPLYYWLFENMNQVDLQNIITEMNEDLNSYANNDTFGENEDIAHVQKQINLDDFEDLQQLNDNFALDLPYIKMSFSLKLAKKELKELMLLYSKVSTTKQQHVLQNILTLKSRITLFSEMFANRNSEILLNLTERTNFSRISTANRWAIYFRWAEVISNDIKKHLNPLQSQLRSATIAYEESRILVDLHIMKGIKVVGMTTSGAARLRKLLQDLAPPIVIVEEAAEVLEQHIVTSLTRNCEHLILIGDHQQLRPSAAHMKLARHYNMEISLFERMITNGMHSRRLGVQHRMRPELAALISPHIYPDLLNHPSVENFPPVRGMADNLFFFTHDYIEEDVDESSSRSNHQEADMALLLANYLMQQGYDPEHITILAAYSGQMFYMRKNRSKYAHISKVKITVVDNYQGEESKIIILSLVRNNNMNKIGFLGTENRVCVALSRAREGFYILGNIEILKQNSELWKKIAATLQNNASLGTALMLKCENHPEQISTISSPEDFEKVPEGGCLLKCNSNLSCGHPCPLMCHGYDRGHVNIKCRRNCERVICELNHECPLLCCEECGPCKQKIEKLLPCGHDMLIYCHQDPADPAVKCMTKVTVTLPSCGHEATKFCFLDINSVKCRVPCVYRVDKCGHMCTRNCHVNDDPEHENYLCLKPCARAKQGCTAGLSGDRGDHQCPMNCYEECKNCTVEVKKKRTNCKHSERVACSADVDEKPCHKNCARILDCGHFCKNKCFEKCGDCKQKVIKVIPDCGHQVAMLCMEEPTRTLCNKNCERILSCGHRCKTMCSMTCDQSKCIEIIDRSFLSPCGHYVSLPCNKVMKSGGPIAPEILLSYCKEPCKKELKCGHFCKGTCSQCHQGRLHAACTQPCQRVNICGHQCKEPCNQVCPPCKVQCEIKCQHSRCNKVCGALCTPCQERCTRRCRHDACTRRCGEPCSRPPCDEPCAKQLRCGHRCRGLCGEPCPDICNICRPHQFPKGLINEDFEDDDILIKLEDCAHFLEVETMDTLMKADKDSIAIRTCPFCRKPIINTHRYKDLVNDMFRNEINPIKERVFGSETIIKGKAADLRLKIIQFSDDHTFILEDNEHIKNAFDNLRTVVYKQKKVSLLTIDMQYQYLNILDIIRESYQKYKEDKLTELKREFLDVIKMLCCVLGDNTKKVTLQLQSDIGNEIKRLNSIMQLSKILTHSSCSKTTHKVVEHEKAAKEAVLTWGVYDQDEAVKTLEHLQHTVNVSGIVTKEERDLVVKAIGSKLGSWYKCPNGHFYCIADCGGAMEISKCADCGVAIGGRSHALLPTNSHAGEIDGSSHSAWSNTYNDMRNFNIH